MPEIRVRKPDVCPEVASCEIHIPDDADLGAGTFTTALQPGVLLGNQTIVSVMNNPPVFEIKATFNTNRAIVVTLGRADAPPRHTAVYLLPPGLDLTQPHALVVEFLGWSISRATLGGAALALRPSAS